MEKYTPGHDEGYRSCKNFLTQGAPRHFISSAWPEAGMSGIAGLLLSARPSSQWLGQSGFIGDRSAAKGFGFKNFIQQTSRRGCSGRRACHFIRRRFKKDNPILKEGGAGKTERELFAAREALSACNHGG